MYWASKPAGGANAGVVPTSKPMAGVGGAKIVKTWTVREPARDGGSSDDRHPTRARKARVWVFEAALERLGT